MTTVHRDRYSTTGVADRKAGVVVHTSESDDTTYGALLALLARPGERPLGNTGRKYGSAYHAITLNHDNLYDQVLEATAGPYAAPPLNKTWWHICMPARVRQTRAEWLDTASLAGIRGVAAFIVAKHRRDGFPLRRLTVAELAAGGEGYVDHWTVSRAFGETDHTDVGANFPWDVLESLIAEQLGQTPPPAPPPLPVFPPPTIPNGDDLMFSQLVTYRGAVFAVYENGYKVWIPHPPALEMFRGLRNLGGLQTPEQVLTDADPQSVAIMHATGPILGPIPAGRDAWGA